MDGGGGGYRGGGRNNYQGGGGGGGGHHKRKFQGGGDHQQRYSQQRRDADEGGDGTRPLLAKLIKCADVPRVSMRAEKRIDPILLFLLRSFVVFFFPSLPSFLNLFSSFFFSLSLTRIKRHTQQPQGAAPPEEEVLAVAKELRRELDGPREETVGEK